MLTLPYMLDDELIVEEHISYVYIEKEQCKVTTRQSPCRIKHYLIAI
jgi:hypothetical protein